MKLAMDLNATDGEVILAYAIPVMMFNALEGVHGRAVVEQVMSHRTSINYGKHSFKRIRREMVAADTTRLLRMMYPYATQIRAQSLSEPAHALCLWCHGHPALVVESLVTAHRIASHEAGRFHQVEALADFYLDQVGGSRMNTFA